MKKVRLLIADDHKIFRQGIIKLLDEEPDLQVVGEAADGREVVKKATDLKPDVILPTNFGMLPGSHCRALKLSRTKRFPSMSYWL